MNQNGKSKKYIMLDEQEITCCNWSVYWDTKYANFETQRKLVYTIEGFIHMHTGTGSGINGPGDWGTDKREEMRRVTTSGMACVFCLKVLK